MRRNLRTILATSVAVALGLGAFHLDARELARGELTTPQARAETTPVRKIGLFVKAKSADEEAVGQVLQSLLRKSLLSLRKVILVTGAPDPPQLIQATAGPLVDQGFRALNDKDTKGAEELFQKAYKMLVNYTGRTDLRLMARGLKGLGVAMAMNGKFADAQKHIWASANLWPGQTAEDYAFDVTVKNSFIEVERKMQEAGTGSLDLMTEPPGAEVWVGSDLKGHSPLTIEDIPAGPQWLTVSLDGYKRVGMFVEIKQGEEEAQAVAFEPHPELASYQTLTQRMTKNFFKKKAMKQLLPAFNQFLNTDGTMVLQMSARGDGYLFSGWYTSGKGVRRVKDVVQQDDQFLDNVQKLLAKTIGATPKPDVTPPPLDGPPASSVMKSEDDVFIDPTDSILREKEQETGDPIHEKWWFWVVLVAATTGVGVLIGTLASGGGEDSVPRGSVVLGLNRVEQ